MSMKEQIATDAAKAAVPVAITASSLFGYSWSDISYMLTAVLTLMLILQNAWKHWVKPLVLRWRGARVG